MKNLAIYFIVFGFGISSFAFSSEPGPKKISTVTAPQTKSKKEIIYKIDPDKSSITWLGKKVVGPKKHYGKIGIQEGEVVYQGSSPTKGYIIIDMKKLTDEDLTNPKWNKKLVDHLKSDDFFDVEKFSTAKFEFNQVTKVEKAYQANGSMTIKNKAKKEVIQLQASVSGNNLTATGEHVFDRTDFDVRYGAQKWYKLPLDKLIADQITLEFKLVATSVKK